SYDLSDDGKKIVYHRAPSPLLGDSWRGEIWVANADGSGAVQVTKNDIPEGSVHLSPDNTQVLFVSGANAKLESYYNGRLFVVPANGGEPRPIVGEKEPMDVDSAVWSADGKSIYFLGNVGVHEEVFVTPAERGVPKALTNGKHNVGSLGRVGSHVIFTVSDSTTAGEIYTMGASDAAPTRVTHVFDYLA